MNTRQIDLMRPWAQWMVRHRLSVVCLMVNWTIQPVAFVAHAIWSSFSELWSSQMDNHNLIRQAAREAKAERTGDAA